MRRREGQVAARRVKVAAASAMTGGLLAAAAFAMSHGPAGHRETTLASAANVGRERAEPSALRVLSISPGNSADPVTAADPVRVVFSAALAPASPLPAFSPAISGRWLAVGGGALVFAPAAPLRATTELTLRIPAGSSGVRSAAGAALAAPVTAVFQAGGWSTLRLEQLLAQIGYLPLTWTPDSDSGLPAAPGGGPVTVSYTERRAAADPVVSNTGGGFSWRGSYPSALTSLWRPGQRGVILTGALMAFQADHGLPMTGAVSPRLWRALLRAAVRGERNPLGYSYALADQARPETLTVWHDGQVVVRGLASTGTAVTPTVLGTFPVYLRNRFQVMRGLMPDGSPYADPVQFVSYFHGDYAVHSMNRPSFGWPQSLGCVELPLSVARRVWPYLTYGSLVTVTDRPASTSGSRLRSRVGPIDAPNSANLLRSL
jgi:L,D-transpeptidase catalytic domain/Bacterial Ig-like domain